MKNRLVIAYVLFSQILIVTMLLKSDFISRVATRTGLSTPPAQPKFSPHFHLMVWYHESLCENVPDEATLFIGDSLIQGQCVAAISPRSVNFGIGGDTTAGVLERLPGIAPAIRNASRVVLAIGVNDIHQRSNDEILENYRRILDQLQGTSVFASSVLPVDPTANSKRSDYLPRITELNAAIRLICNSRNDVTFIDNTLSLDQDGDGQLDSDLHCGDGLHLSPAGNDSWAMNLKVHLGK